MGISTPGGDETDEFIVPGGQPAPEHLTADNLSFIGHLLANPFQALSTFCEFSSGGREPDAALGQEARKGRRIIIETVDYLLRRYGTDIDAIPGLRAFLMQFQQDVKDFRWSNALDDLRAAKVRFKF